MEGMILMTKDLSQARNPDIRGSLAALRRASELARKIAIQTGTDLVVVRDGRLLHVDPATLRERTLPAKP
jgi:hypothetical protein